MTADEQRIEAAIPLGSRVRIRERYDFIEGIVLEHSDAEEYDDTVMDWPEEAECHNIMWVQLFDFTNLWWFDTQQSEILIDGQWLTFNEVMARLPVFP